MKKVLAGGLLAALLMNVDTYANRIGYDDFDGAANYLTRVNSGAINAVGAVWDIVNRAAVQSQVILDTSKYLQNGGAGDGEDAAGFLESAKTDHFFGLYRGGYNGVVRTLTYTFDISGASNLSLSLDWIATGDVVAQGIVMTASIDGGTAQTLFSVGSAQDPDGCTTMEDGRVITHPRSGPLSANGVFAGTLTDSWTACTANITGSGSVLTLTLSMTGTSAGSAYGLDNLVLYSGTASAADVNGGFKFSLLAGTAASESNAPTYRHVAYGDSPEQILNFWKAESDHPTPVVFIIHGGGWHGGAIDESPSMPFLSQGASYCTIEYRMINNPSVLLPVPVLDAARALQFLRSKAVEWGIDKDRIVLLGGSAGGCTGLWLAFHDDLADPASPDPVARESTRVKGGFFGNAQTTLDPFVINEWIGMHCVNHLMIWDSVGASSAEDLMTNWDKYKNLSWDFSPIRHLNAGDPPVYLNYGILPDQPATNSAEGIHHSMFGVKLKEQSDQIGHTCYISIPGYEPVPAISSSQFIKNLLFN